MPDRVIRDELLSSERWLSLKDNSDRLAFVVLLLSSDALGNLEAGEFRLLRIWRDFGINTVPLVNKVLSELADCDLVRIYNADEKRYLHIPRYRQELRYLKRHFPLSPWTTDAQKQAIAKNSRRANDVQAPSAHEKRSEEKRSEEKKTKGARPALPDWLPSETWGAFREHRQRLRAPMTERAEALMFASLERFRTAGYSPVDLLNEAMLRGWKAPVDPVGRLPAPSNGKGRVAL